MWINRLKGFLWIIFLLTLSSHASGQHYDCERPPTVEHASSRLSVDENEDAVSARYTCEPGFELRGEPDVFCDLDTDEWEGQLPSCHKADNAAASAETGAADHQQQPKKQHHNVPEETTIDDDLASRLDLSCMGGQGAAKPPNIENAYVVKFNRRRKGDKVFLVAFYDCEESYELKNPLVDRLYCSQQSWIGDKPQCIFVEDGENGEEEDDYNENVYEDEISQEVHPNGVIHPEERENGEVEEEEEYHEEDYEENSQEVPELPPPAPVTPAPTTAPPPQTTTAFDPNCGPDRGGCDHECRRVLSDHGESHTECSCFTGYELNVRDGRTCNDIDECAIRNGGCEQHCRNAEGSFECSCNEGFKIDPGNGRSCIDVNECEDGELAARCVHGCENLHGSYRCLEPTTTTTEKPADVPPLEQDYKENEDPLRGDHRREEDDYVEPEEEDLYREYEEETNEVEPHPDVEQDTPCPEGYFRDHDEQCKDINECDDPRLGGRCPHGCQNVDGSFFCSEPTTTTTTTTTTVQPPVECPEGFQRTSEGNCEDINECDDPNLGGRCPYGCQNVEGSFFCSEPPPVATRAPQQPEIQEVSPTESSSTESPCGDGFRRNQGGYCEDIDECREQNTGCEHCKNVHGGFECFCPQGYELREDQKTCEDINECEIYSQEDSNAIPGSSSLCTHDCENLPGSFACHCPENFHLDYDQRTCVRDSCADLTTFRKTLCSHNCLDTGDGFFSCQCPTGYVLATDFKTCQQVADPCSGHTTCHPGRCFPVEDHHSGQHTFRCDCPEGFTEKHQQCLDVDECSRGLHRCTHECRNKEGGYDCICPAGFELAEDGATCLDQDECLTLEKPCGGQQCVNTHGSYKCVCPEGHELHEDGVTCTLVDPCQRNNGGCSHQCRMYDQNRVTCSCPEGYELSYDGRTCQDVDECSQPARGECDPINGACVNSEGSYSCLCKPGYLLGTDNRTCLSQHPCESAGCQHYCEMNSQSEPICSCRMGFKLDKDRRSCLEIRNLCPPIRAPEHGEMRCTRSRHPTQLFYKTRCSIWCHKGYKLDGSAERTCNGSGTWNGDEPVCVPKACPRLPRPHYGTIFPTSCMLNGSAAGARCMLHCFPKYKPVGKQSAICDANNNWFPSGELTCVSVQETENRVEIIKPFIRCPEDVTIVAPRGQSAFRIRLQRPQTNVDWWKYIDTHPEWAKHLEGTVPLGTTDITFRARSPNANLNEICRMKVTVKEPEPPEVTFCPESFEVQLEDGEAHKPVYWKEPVFTTRSSLKNIYKSRQPGERFAPGTHFITYVATDIDGHNSKCTFRIVVKEPPSAPPKPVQFIPVQKPSKLLDNHESFLVCPGKAAVRIDTNYPLHRTLVRHHGPSSSPKSSSEALCAHLSPLRHNRVVVIATPDGAIKCVTLDFHFPLEQLHLPAGCYVKNILIRYDVIRKPKQQEEQQQNSQQIQRIPPHQRFLLHQPQRPQFFWPHHNALPLRHHHQQQQHRWAFPHLLERGRWQ